MEKYILKIDLNTILKRGHYLYHFYFWIYGLFYDFKIAKRTLGHTVYTDCKGANPAQSISYYYLNELKKNIKYSDDDVFVDVGCAWGRLIGYMRIKTKIKNFIGVEVNESVAEFARNTFSNDKNVKIIVGSILDEFPREGTIYYLFNPFDEKVLKSFLENIEKDIKGTIRVLYLHPVYCDAFKNRNGWTLTEIIKLKPKHMGELVLHEYTYKNIFVEKCIKENAQNY